MPPLSNSTRTGDVLQSRPAHPAEIETAIAILLAGAPGRASGEQVQAFVALAAHRGMNLDDLWIAVLGADIQWAMLPVVSPGRTMLLLSPPSLPKDLPLDSILAVVEGACEFHRKRGVHLAQLLIDPAEMPLRLAYVQAGFTYLAELIYLQREVRKVPSIPPMPPSLELTNYSAQAHDLFLRTIARSYEQSLDCPGLSGLREMEDVVLGHKAAGEFDPSLWFVLTENREPRGVLLLSLATHANALELVYLGLTPEARGKGFGEVLMKLALLSVVRHNRAELTLAVDSRNVPATRLYFRHGMRRMGSRAAMIRNLARESDKPRLGGGLTEDVR
jgi:ribosomal protein S18 acetylase RimI-like enzyme